MHTLLQLINQRHSKAQADEIVSRILSGEIKILDLMDCFFSPDEKISQRAAWPVGKLADTNPDLFLPYVGSMNTNLNRPVHDAVKRNTVRVWSKMQLPEAVRGDIYNRCFDYIQDASYPAAIRVFALSVCTNIAMDYAELAPELIEVIREHRDYGTAGFKNRANKSINRLKNLSI